MISKSNIAISHKLVFDANLVLGLFIAYEALPTKAIPGMIMQILVQVTCYSKITNNGVKHQAGHHSTTDFSGNTGSLGNLSHTMQFI